MNLLFRSEGFRVQEGSELRFQTDRQTDREEEMERGRERAKDLRKPSLEAKASTPVTINSTCMKSTRFSVLLESSLIAKCDHWQREVWKRHELLRDRRQSLRELPEVVDGLNRESKSAGEGE